MLRSADPGCSRKYGGHRGHLLTVSLLTLGQPHLRVCPLGLDHRNPFAIHRRHQHRAGISPRWGIALGIEGIEVRGRIWDDFFDTARVNRRAGNLRDALAGFPKSSLHGGLQHAFLQFVGKRARGQLQAFVERMDAGGAGVRVAHASDLDGAKDGLQQTRVQATVGVHHKLSALDDP